MRDVGNAGPLQGHIHVVILRSLTCNRRGVTWGHNRIGVQVDAADNGGGRGLVFPIEEPGLLMLAEAGRGLVPANLNVRAFISQPREVLRLAPERVSTVRRFRGIRAPEDDSDVHAARRGRLQHVKQAPGVGHCEGRPQERDGDPDACRRRVRQRADSTERGQAVDERRHPIACPSWVSALNKSRVRIRHAAPPGSQPRRPPGRAPDRTS